MVRHLVTGAAGADTDGLEANASGSTTASTRAVVAPVAAGLANPVPAGSCRKNGAPDLKGDDGTAAVSPRCRPASSAIGAPAESPS
jgi:hypothetical protein